MFEEHDILPGRLSDNLQEISSRQGPESKVAVTVSGRPAYSGLPDFIQHFFESEAVFCIREIVVSSQSRAIRIDCALGGKKTRGFGLLFVGVVVARCGCRGESECSRR